jgi:6-pyruvoyltetrahydropterin/6-carboxytetrahydropterin synthase
MYELSKRFRFDAAHSLRRRVDAEPSRRFHGHSYWAEVTLRGLPDQQSGMVMDLGLLDRAIVGARDALDHRMLDDVEDLGPATLENLAAWLWRRLEPDCPGLHRVSVGRESYGDRCSYFGVGSPPDVEPRD